MPIVDERGRIFGRLNLIDFAVGLCFFLLVPLGYGAYVLFRTPVPDIIAVEPPSLQQGQDLRVKLRGTNFRAYLRATFGAVPAPGFLVESPSAAEIRLPELAPGTYDLVLYDEFKEIARRPNALTIVPPPAPPPPPPPPPLPPSAMVQLTGEFTAVAQQWAKKLAVGTRFPDPSEVPIAEIVAVRPPMATVVRIKGGSGSVDRPVGGKVQVPAILRLRCTFIGTDCKVADVTVGAGATISLTLGTEVVLFRIFDVIPPERPPVFPPDPVRRVAEMLVRFVVRPEALPLLAVGATDQNRTTATPGPPTAAAELIAFKKTEEFEGEVSVEVGGPDRNGNTTRTGVTQRLALVEATLEVPVEWTAGGWRYNGQLVKLGGPFVFEGDLYVLTGWILRFDERQP